MQQNPDSVFFNHLRIAHKFEIRGVNLEVFDFMTSNTPPWTARDLQQDVLNFEKMGLQRGDFVLDVGANIGMVAIYLAKKYGVFGYAVEPMPHNFANLAENLAKNDVTQHFARYRMAVVDRNLHGAEVELEQSPVNSGGASLHRLEQAFQCPKFKAPTISLDELVNLVPPGEKVKLLKMDIEGGEYEALRAFTRWDRVEWLAVELHPHGCQTDDIAREQKEFHDWLETKLPGRVMALVT